jgi:hypothetical protein
MTGCFSFLFDEAFTVEDAATASVIVVSVAKSYIR